jgi:hypothetical protein
MRHRHGWEIVGSPPFLGRKLRQDAPSSPESSHFWRGMPSVNPAVPERPQSAFKAPKAGQCPAKTAGIFASSAQTSLRRGSAA